MDEEHGVSSNVSRILVQAVVENSRLMAEMPDSKDTRLCGEDVFSFRYCTYIAPSRYYTPF